MNAEPKYQGIIVDGETALALLAWQAELGADESIGDDGLDRFELPEKPKTVAQPALPVSAPSAQTKPALPEGPDRTALIAEAEALAASAETLEELAAKQEAFDGIELKKGARNFCFSDGNPKARLLILGEAPGDEEDRQGRPFVGRAGQLLDRMFSAIGHARDAVDAEKSMYIMNVLTWHPPGNRDPLPDEIAASLPFVRRHIELIAPDVIVLTGNIACEAAIGRRGILRLRGNWTEAFGRPAMPITHPAYLLRNPPAKREAWADLLSIAAKLEPLG